MKSPEALVADIHRRLNGRWAAHLAGEAAAFPHVFPLGRPSASELRQNYTAVHARTVEWQDWARARQVVLGYENRVATGRTTQAVPSHAQITSIDHAASIVAGDWAERLTRGRLRLAVLQEIHPDIADLPRTLRIVEGYSDSDFGLLLTVAAWYLQDPTRATLGVTPRQVPLPGVHAKWLQNHRPAVLALTGLDDLGLLAAHPRRIHFTYLDPEHLAAGGRVHDSATVGDSSTPAYLPEVVVISENKDTAIHFPPLTGGISVEGVGRGGKTPASFDWIREAPVVVYWGDIDRDGFEILNGYRVDFDRDIDSIFMDEQTYQNYEEFGTSLDQNGRPLAAGTTKPVERLRSDERCMYLRVLDAQESGHRRIEQERIPLDRALEAVQHIRERSAKDIDR